MSRVNFYYIVFAYILIFILFLPACKHRSHVDKRDLHYNYPRKNNSKSKKQALEAPPITIWIHGTKLVRQPTFHTVFKNKTTLVPVTDVNANHMLHVCAQAISRTNPDEFPLETFYVFGWNGKILSSAREHAAQQLYTDLQNLIAQYKKQYHTYPFIRIITHSHGGNIALKLAKYQNQNDIELMIESLILLACPVQEHTVDLVNNPMFKNVYALYSSLDIIQTLAPQVLKRTITDEQGKTITKQYRIPRTSSRRFPFHPNVMQAKIKVNGHAIFHNSFANPYFLEMLPLIITKLDTWYIEDHAYSHGLDNEKLLCIYKHQKHRYH